MALSCGSPDIAWLSLVPPHIAKDLSSRLTLRSVVWIKQLADGQILQLRHIRNHDCGSAEVVNVHGLPQACGDQSPQNVFVSFLVGLSGTSGDALHVLVPKTVLLSQRSTP